ncbi:MAG: hypothetical protein RL605_961 [Actinomycetota bacterium]|jgi:thiol-disulfide isomerase/thioredoxin
MPLEAKLGILFAVIAIAAIAGLTWRTRTGRAKASKSNEVVDLRQLASLKNGELVTKFGKTSTFLQFSSEYCTQCKQTARILAELEKADDGVLHIEVDITNRLDLAKQYSILQTPTTLVLDSKGRVRSRIGGLAKPQVIKEEAEKASFEI